MFSKLLLPLLLLLSIPAYSSTLNIDYDYRLRGISFANNDFNVDTSTDAVSYYTQNLSISIGGNFPGIEIAAKLTALGVVGSTNTLAFMNATRYPSHNMTPFIENANIKIIGIEKSPIDIIVGKQNLSYGDGFIIGDNGIANMALRFLGSFNKPFLPWQAEVFIAKISENFTPESDHDVFGAVFSCVWKSQKFEVSYFDDSDYSGTEYSQGSLSANTSAIIKQFVDFRIGKREKEFAYQFELAKQNGYVRKKDNSRITLDGIGYLAYGELVGEKTKLGKVVAHALFQVASGDDNTLSIDDDDGSFSPTLSKRYDGLEKSGYGELMAVNPMGGFFELPTPYSGINTLSVGAAFSPLYAWTFDVTC